MLDDRLDEGPRHQRRVGVNPNVMDGKPVAKRTRIPVSPVLRHVSDTLDRADRESPASARSPRGPD